MYLAQAVERLSSGQLVPSQCLQASFLLTWLGRWWCHQIAKRRHCALGLIHIPEREI